MLDATYEIDPLVRSGDPGNDVRGHVSLLVTWGEHARAIALREGQSLVLGRARPSNWVIEHRSLSRKHARLSLHDGEVTLEDLGSTNGCLLNGTRVHKVSVGEGDLVQLGAVELRICAQTGLQTQPDTVPHAAFMRALAEELTRARLFARSFAVVALKHDEDPAVRQAVLRALKPLDRLCPYAAGISLVLVPEHDAGGVRRWLATINWPTQCKHRGGIAAYPAVPCSADTLVSRALDACHAAPYGQALETEAPANPAYRPPVVQSPCMLRVYDLVARAARTPLTVLIQGETGSGKELVARAVHDGSPRARAPFKALNCATIPTNLLESTLFGHERGAFTGADRQVQGVFEQAQGGSVFLDEVGELSPQAQAALLRVLEQRRIVRVGGTREIEVDVRVIAATHRNLAAMVQAGTFREDLMFRLDALTFKVPPLRERREEIVPMAESFLARARQEWGASARQISEDVQEALTTYRWPGNVRQLKNVLERAAAVCAGERLELEDLPEEVWLESADVPPTSADACGEIATPSDGEPEPERPFRPLPLQVREFETAIIREALQKAKGNLAQAGRLLGVPRRTLVSKVQVYGLVQLRDGARPLAAARKALDEGESRPSAGDR